MVKQFNNGSSCCLLVSVDPSDLHNIYINLHKEPHVMVLGTYLGKIDERTESLNDNKSCSYQLWRNLGR